MTTKKKSPSKPAKTGKKPSGGISPRSKLLIWCGAIFGVLLAAVLLVAWLTFSSYRDFPAPMLEEPHRLLLRRLATELRNNRQHEEAAIFLTPQEANLLLDIIRHLSQFARDRKVPPPKNFMIRYRDDGGVFVSAPAAVAGEWCFGGRIYVSGVLFFEKQDGRIIAEMPELRFGRFDIPVPGGLDTIYPSWKQRLTRSLPREFMSSVKSLGPKRDGTIVLVYRPQELRRPLKRTLTRVERRSSGEIKMLVEQLIKSL